MSPTDTFPQITYINRKLPKSSKLTVTNITTVNHHHYPCDCPWSHCQDKPTQPIISKGPLWPCREGFTSEGLTTATGGESSCDAIAGKAQRPTMRPTSLKPKPVNAIARAMSLGPSPCDDWWWRMPSVLLTHLHKTLPTNRKETLPPALVVKVAISRPRSVFASKPYVVLPLTGRV